MNIYCTQFDFRLILAGHVRSLVTMMLEGIKRTLWSIAFLRDIIQKRPQLLDIAGNTGWLLADKIIRMGVGLFVGVWMARYLGPERFGLFNYAMAIVAIFSSVASLGLDSIVVRNLVVDSGTKNEILGTTFILKLLAGITVFFVTVGTINLLHPHDTIVNSLVAVIVAGTVFQAFETIDLWFQSQVQSKFTVLARSSAFLLTSASKIVLIVYSAPLQAFAWAGFAEVVISTIGLIAAYRLKQFRLSVWRGSLKVAGHLLKDCWPLIFSGIVSMIYLRIDQVMLMNMVGSHEAGIYAAAVRVAEAWYLIPMAISSSFFPSIVKARAQGEDVFYGCLQKYYNLMALLGYAIAIPMTFLSGWIVEIVFGEVYRSAGPMLALLIWGGIFINIGIARSSFLLTMNWNRIYFFTVLGGCVINIALNYLLIPSLGGMGAVIASCVAYWFAAHGACFFFKPLYRTGGMLTKALFYPRIPF